MSEYIPGTYFVPQVTVCISRAGTYFFLKYVLVCLLFLLLFLLLFFSTLLFFLLFLLLFPIIFTIISYFFKQGILYSLFLLLFKLFSGICAAQIVVLCKAICWSLSRRTTCTSGFTKKMCRYTTSEVILLLLYYYLHYFYYYTHYFWWLLRIWVAPNLQCTLQHNVQWSNLIQEALDPRVKPWKWPKALSFAYFETIIAIILLL